MRGHSADWRIRIEETRFGDERVLVAIDDDEALFVHRRRDSVSAEPEWDSSHVIGILWWTFVFGLGVAIRLDGVELDAIGATAFAGLAVFWFWQVWSFVRRTLVHRRWKESRRRAFGSTRWLGVRFCRADGVVRAVGPFDSADEAVTETSPVSSEAPLARVSIEESHYRGIPWSDVYDADDGPDSLTLELAIDRRASRELSGRFDLLDGLSWSYAGAVGIGQPGVAERRRHAEVILGRRDETDQSPSTL